MTWFRYQQIMNRLAAHLGRGEPGQVVECAERVLRDRPDDKLVMFLMANSLDELEQHERAANIRQLILEIDPDDRDSLFHLGRHHERAGHHDLACQFFERFLNSPERSYPVQESDYRFMRFVTRLWGGSPEVIENSAREASLRIDQEAQRRQKHAKKYLSVLSRRRAKAADA